MPHTHMTLSLLHNQVAPQWKVTHPIEGVVASQHHQNPLVAFKCKTHYSIVIF